MGASAGGLEVFQQFFDRMPAESGMAFILIQHLDPHHDTLMPELLSKHTTMPVQIAQDGLKVQANHVYVIAPNACLTMEGCTLRMTPLPQTAERKLIDQFFRSLAADQHENVVGIILSGTGCDGTMGLKAIKESGGLTMAQAPDTARFDSMPRNVISTGCVDYVLPVEEMPARIIEYNKHLDVLQQRKGAETIQQEAATYLPEIFPILKKQTGHDFSRYKQSTLVRRIQRRMQVGYLDSVPAYVHFLRENPKEVDLLFKDLLIGVTQFFRDAESFAVLAKKVIPALFREKREESQLRIWIPGCSTGEEAYSFAILLAEHAASVKELPKLQVFASDLDVEALDFARKGIYPADIAEQISPERLQQFFRKVGSGYEVVNEIREICIFSPHNLIKDPPFSRLDLISCRNLLIYLEADLQKKLLPLFHYALNPCGFLFLGPSENVASRSEFFRAVDQPHRIFQRKPTVLHAPGYLPMMDRGRVTKLQMAVAPQFSVPKEQSLARSIERVILEEYAPASVVINDQGEVIYFSGDTGKYLQPPAGVPTNKLIGMARKSLRLELRAAVHRAVTSKEEVVRRFTVKNGRKNQPVNLIVRPLTELADQTELYVVLFQELVISGSSAPTVPLDTFAHIEHPIIKQLETELRTTKEDLQTTIEEVETSNEELKSANEELLSMNEELQSGNEELQTSKEEVQSANDELQRKIEELNTTQEQRGQLAAIVEGSQDAIYAMTFEGVITSWNSAAEKMYGFPAHEAIGHNVSVITPGDRLAELKAVHQRIKEGKHSEVFETIRLTKDRREIVASITWSAVRDFSGNIVGISSIARDVTEKKKNEAALQRNEKLLNDFFDNGALGLHWVGPDGTILRANRTELELLGYAPEEYIGRHIREFHADAPVIADILEKLSCGQTLDNYQARLRCKDGSIKHVLINSNVLWENGKFLHTRCFTRDITKEKLAEEALRKSNQRFINMVESITDGLLVLDKEWRFVYLNSQQEEIIAPLGKSRQSLLGKVFWEEIPNVLGTAVEEYFRRAVEEQVTIRFENFYPPLDAWFEVRIYPIAEEGGVSVFTQNITARKEAEETIFRNEAQFRALADSIPQLAWMAEPDGNIFWYNRRWFEYTGTTLEQMAGWGWQSVHDQSVLPMVVERWKKSIATGDSFEMEFPLRGADGVFRWFLTRVSPMLDGSGKIRRWFGTNTDVDEVRRTREALREETRVLEFLNKTGKSIASQLDLQKLVQTVTDAGTEISGAKFGAFFYTTTDEKGEAMLLYTLSGAPREAFEKFGHPRATALFGPTFKGEGPVRCDDVQKDPRYGKMAPHHGMPHGHLPVRSYLAVPVASRTGEVLGGLFFGHPEPKVFTERSERLIVGIAAQAATAIDNARLYEAAQKEIAERKRAEAALSRRVRLAAFRAEIGHHLAMADPQEAVLQKCAQSMVDHLDGAFARVWILNHTESILELQASAGMYTHLNGAHARIRMGEYKIGRIAQGCKPHLTNDVEHDSNISDPAWARAEGMVAFVGYPLSLEGRVLGVVAMFARQPLSEEVIIEMSTIANGLSQWIERKRVQADLQRAKDELEEKVEERTAALQETTAQLETFCYTIAHDLRSPLRAQQSFAQVVLDDNQDALNEDSRNYLQRIVKSANRLDKLVNDLLVYSRLNRDELVFTKVDMGKVLADVQASIADEIASKGASVKVATLPAVRAYEPTLNLVITNLLGNALKFVKPGVAPEVKIWSESKGDLIRLWIEDNGIGISADNTEKIFGVFHRLHSADKYPGTGIGLAIVQKCVERMAGTVGVESEPGNGSRFWIELPQGC